MLSNLFANYTKLGVLGSWQTYATLTICKTVVFSITAIFISSLAKCLYWRSCRCRWNKCMLYWIQNWLQILALEFRSSFLRWNIFYFEWRGGWNLVLVQRGCLSTASYFAVVARLTCSRHMVITQLGSESLQQPPVYRTSVQRPTDCIIMKSSERSLIGRLI